MNSVKLGLAGGIVWGAWLAILTLLGATTCFGLCFLKAIGCLFPCYTISLCGVFIALFWGFIQGFVGLFLVALIYNVLGGHCES